MRNGRKAPCHEVIVHFDHGYSGVAEQLREANVRVTREEVLPFLKNLEEGRRTGKPVVNGKVVVRYSNTDGEVVKVLDIYPPNFGHNNSNPRNKGDRQNSGKRRAIIFSRGNRNFARS